MTCPECEDLLALEKSSEELAGHLAACAECRELAEELRSNTEALREMAAVELPSVRGAVIARLRAQSARQRMARWGWALAAAAAVLIVFGVTRTTKVDRPAPPLVTVAPAVEQPFQTAAAVRPNVRRPGGRRQAGRPAPQQLLKVKMFTSDPDVVIYWLIEPKEGSE
jgi:hypothetical protein